MLNEVMRYLHDNYCSGFEANKCVFMAQISQYRHWIGEFTKAGFFFTMKTSCTYQHSLFENNSNSNHYSTNYSLNNRFVSTNDQLNS